MARYSHCIGLNQIKSSVRVQCQHTYSHMGPAWYTSFLRYLIRLLAIYISLPGARLIVFFRGGSIVSVDVDRQELFNLN